MKKATYKHFSIVLTEIQGNREADIIKHPTLWAPTIPAIAGSHTYLAAHTPEKALQGAFKVVQQFINACCAEEGLSEDQVVTQFAY